MSHPATTLWLQKSLHRLAAEGFVITEVVGHPGAPMRALARRSRFELTKCGFSETFFVFREFDSISVNALRQFSADAFNLAIHSKTVQLPCGLFESVWCFAVVIAGSLEDSVIESVRRAAPVMHWAAAEIPVVFDRDTGRLHYFEKTPIWGAAYYAGFRAQIKRCLAHDAML